MTTCHHCRDTITLDPNEAEEYVDSEWNQAPKPGEWLHHYTGGVFCDGVKGSVAEPDLRVGA